MIYLLILVIDRSKYIDRGYLMNVIICKIIDGLTVIELIDYIISMLIDDNRIYHQKRTFIFMILINRVLDVFISASIWRGKLKTRPVS